MSRHPTVAHGNPISVFIADAQHMFCQGIDRLFTDDLRFRTLGWASKGEEALARIRELNPEVAILSFSAQGLDGIELTSLIVAENLTTRCIVLTFQGERYVHQRAFLAGAKGCVFKEASFAILADTVQRISGGETTLRMQGPIVIAAPQGAQPGLSDREEEVLRLVGRGLTTKQIAECLFIGVRTVDSHRLKIMRKLKIPNATGLVKYAFEHNLDSW